MAGKSLVRASGDQRIALKALAKGADRGKADRARAGLLTLAGWTSARIAEAFGVREDTRAAMARAESFFTKTRKCVRNQARTTYDIKTSNYLPKSA